MLNVLLAKIGPIITKVDPDSLAEESGLRSGDTVLEINGTKTNGLANRSIANLIQTAGNKIVFLVGRKRQQPLPPQVGFVDDDAVIRESAYRITQDTIEEAKSRVQQQQLDEYSAGSASPSATRRLSRRDSAQQSPRLVHEEIKMSSSKLYGQQIDAGSSSSMSASPLTYPTSTSQQFQVEGLNIFISNHKTLVFKI